MVCMVVSLDARINTTFEKFTQYQCQNCRSPLEIQDILIAQAESVWEKEIVYLCQRCRKEKQKGTVSTSMQVALIEPSTRGSEIVPYEDPIDSFKESAFIARRRRVNQQRSPVVSEKKWWKSLIGLFSRQTDSAVEDESVHSDSASLVTLVDFSLDSQPSEGTFEFAQFAGRFFSARQGSHELGVTFPWSGLNGRRFMDLPGKIVKIVDFEGAGFLVVTDDKKKPLFWYSENGLKEYSEKMINESVKDPVMRDRIKSHHPKNKVSSKKEHDDFLASHGSSVEHVYSSIDYDQLGAPHIYERVQSNPDYQTLYPEVPLRPSRPVQDLFSSTYIKGGVIHTDV